MGEAKLHKKRIAYHEAGHAVIARLHGVDVTSVEMTPTFGVHSAMVQTRSAAWVERENPNKDVRINAIKIDTKVSLAGTICL